MADNVNITPGSGDVVAADQVTDGVLGQVKVQYVKLMDGTIDGTSKAAVGANGLSVNVAASVLPPNAATSSLQTSGAQKTQIVDGSGNVASMTSNALNVAVTTGTISAGTAGSPSSNIVSVQGVTNMTAVAVGGDVASGTTDAGNPVKVGGQARVTFPTAVADGARVNGVFDKIGRQLGIANLRTMTGTEVTTISGTTETTIVTAQVGFFLDLYGLVLANSGATAATVTIKNGTAGTTACVIHVPAGDTRSFMLPLDAGLANAAVNANWTATCSAATTMNVSAFYVKNI